jgi:amidase
MLVGIKPTVGRISRHGVIPISADMDTPGPMAKSVTDAAILLGVLEGGGRDPDDPATGRCQAPAKSDYTAFLDKNGLKGARIGIPRTLFYDKVKRSGDKEPRGGLTPEQLALMEEAIAVLRAQGAVVVDPAEIPSVLDARDSLIDFSICTSVEEVKERKCSVDLAYGMERDFNGWLKSLGSGAPVKSLTELRQWNAAHQKAGAIKYGQSLLDVSDFMDLELFRARYEADRAHDLLLTATHGIDETLATHKLDALLFPGGSGANLAARPGYPSVIVPFGSVPNAPKPPFPDSFNARPSPYGVTFTGTACSEPVLLRLAYAFEQATHKRVPPPLFP